MRRRDNVQKITHLMVMDPGGPLTQALVLEAVRQYCSDIVAAGRPSEDSRAWINPVAVYTCAEGILEALDNMETDAIGAAHAAGD
jgi:hypothetical protein